MQPEYKFGDKNILTRIAVLTKYNLSIIIIVKKKNLGIIFN